jgi:biotin operon repressor
MRKEFEYPNQKEPDNSLSTKDKLRQLVEDNPDRHFTLAELEECLNYRVTVQDISKHLQKLKKEGVEFSTNREYQQEQKAEQKRVKAERRNNFLEHIKRLVKSKYSEPEIQRIFAEDHEKPMGVGGALNALRNAHEIPRRRKHRRSKEEMLLSDGIVKDMYTDGKTYAEMMAVTGLDFFLINDAVKRLAKNGEINTRKNN